MAAKCKKCDPHELCEECPEWIFTLADLIMCMMGLFVILWVLKPGMTAKAAAADASADKKQTEVIAAIREAFGHDVNPASKDPIDLFVLQQMAHRSDGPREKGMLKDKIESPQGTDPQTTSIRMGKLSLVGDRVMFEKGSADLSLAAKQGLDAISDQIRGHRNIVMVKGHTSLDDFDGPATDQQKMDLSVKRAQAIADYLTSKNVSPEIIRVQGCSTFEPVLQRVYTSESIGLNRRGEVEVTASLAEDFQDRPQPVNANP